jgi:hypothetical protein
MFPLTLSRAQLDEILRALREPAARLDHILTQALEAAWWDGCRTGFASGLALGLAAGVVLTCLVIRARSNP